MMEKYERGASKDVYKIDIGDKSWICGYEPETKQQSTVWAFEPEANPSKVVRGKITSKQMVACFFGKTGHVATVPLEHRRTVILSGTSLFVCLKSSEKFEKQSRED